MIIENVKNIIDGQRVKGELKYKISIDNAQMTAIEWILNTQEELADTMIYLEALKKELRSGRISRIARLETEQIRKIELDLMHEIVGRLEGLLDLPTKKPQCISNYGIKEAIEEIKEMIEETEV